MAALRPTFVSVVVLMMTMLVGLGASTASAQSRRIGQVIDDTMITAEVKAKLAAEKLSNLTKITVTTRDGVVTLGGAVDDAERAATAARLAASVNGVKSVINAIDVVASAPAPPAPSSSGSGASGSTTSRAPAPLPPPVPAPAPPGVDVTGVVASVDPVSGTITLRDGRVLKIGTGAMVWQPTGIEALRPGAQVLIRGAAPLAVDGGTSPAPGDWRMGTVRTVNAAASQLVLSDGTVVRVAPSTYVHRGADRLRLDQVAPGSEIVFRPSAGAPAAATGSASPSPAATAPTLDASEINVVWAPSAVLR